MNTWVKWLIGVLIALIVLPVVAGGALLAYMLIPLPGPDGTCDRALVRTCTNIPAPELADHLGVTWPAGVTIEASKRISLVDSETEARVRVPRAQLTEFTAIWRKAGYPDPVLTSCQRRPTLTKRSEHEATGRVTCSMFVECNSQNHRDVRRVILANGDAIIHLRHCFDF